MENSKNKLIIKKIFSVLIEYGKVLILITIVSAVLTYTLVSKLPKTFESSAVLKINEEDLAIINYAPVIDRLIREFGDNKDEGIKSEEQRRAFRNKFRHEIDKKNKLITLYVRDRSPEKGGEIIEKTIQLILEANQKLNSSEIEFQKKLIKINKEILDEEIEKENSIILLLKSQGLTDLEKRTFLKQVSNNSSAVSTRRIEIIKMEEKIRNKSIDEIMIQEPLNRSVLVAPKIFQITVLASATILLLTIFALLVRRRDEILE